jgi:2-polyprenyl-6-methoxyphenol hydroxylase-like FAD-dependent oxidoreductase
MAAALALARRGHEVVVYEAFAEPKPVGAGLLLQPTGLKALEALGLAEAVRDAGARVERLQGRDLTGRMVMDLDYTDWRPGGHGIGIHRAVLFQTLLEPLAPAGVTVETGARIVRIEDPGHPTLHDEQGRTHGPFDLVVVADGSGSTLRGMLRPKARAPVYPWGAVWTNAPDETGAFSGALRQVYHRAEIMAGVLPVGGGLVSLFWSLPVAEMDAFFARDIDDWKAQLTSVWPEVEPLLAHVRKEDLARAVYRDVFAGRWNAGACVLLGDAAHGTSPQLGQGANLALVDAVELAERLKAPVAVSLGGFQAARRRHTGLYQLASWALTPLFQSRGSFWPAVRDWLFTPLSKAPGFKHLGAQLLTGTLRLGRWPKVTRP